MAKLSAALAGIFTFSFLVFALPIAHARTQSLSLTENEESKSDFNPIVRLPSNTDKAESELSQGAEKLPTPEDRTVEFVPLKFARFRPVNRHFGLRLGLPSSRSCHHHLHRHPHRDGLFPRYGVAVARDGENVGFNPVIVRGRVRRIPPRWISIPQFHHHHHHHDDEKKDHEVDEFQSVLKHEADFIKEKLRKRFHHDLHNDDSDDEEDEKIFKRKEQKHEEDHDDDNLQSVLKHSADFAKKKWKKHSHHNHDEGDIYDEEDENMFKRKAHKHEKKKWGRFTAPHP